MSIRDRGLVVALIIGALVLATGSQALALTVEIIHPETDPFGVVVGSDIYFEAVAYDEADENVSDQVTWLWDFGDNETSDENPILHAYESAGNYEVTATATLGAAEAQDTITAQIDEQEEGAEGWLVKCTRAHTPLAGWWYEPVQSPVCDLRYIVVAPPAGLGAEFKGVDLVCTDAEGVVVVDEYVAAQGGVEVGPDQDNLTTYSRAVAYEWHTYSHNETFTFDIVAHIELDGVEDTKDLGKKGWTAINTVLSSGSGVILFDPAGPPALSNPEITWATVHSNQSLEELPPGEKQFDMYIWIYGPNGEPVEGGRTYPVTGEGGGKPIGSYDIGGGSWHWDGSGQGRGVYTYLLAAKCRTDQHDYCCDYDKSQQLVISDVSVTDFRWSELNYPDVAFVDLHYTLSRDAASPVTVKLFKPDLSEGTTYLGPPGELPNDAGTHEVVLGFAVQRDLMGAYTFVISANETEEDGDLNRVREPKPALQKGAVQVIWPPAYAAAGEGIDPSATLHIAALLELTDFDDTKYVSALGYGRSEATTVAASKFEEVAVLHINAHARTSMIAFDWWSGESGHYDLLASSGEDVPENAYYHIPNIGGEGQSVLDHVLFAMYTGCNTAELNDTNRDLIEATLAKGVHCAGGFEDTIWWPISHLYLDRFWECLMLEGSTISDADNQAVADVIYWYYPFTGGMETFWCNEWNLRLLPARFGP